MAIRQMSPEVLVPYVPRIALHWAADNNDDRWRVVDGSLVFVDISGFTALSERLARRGRQGAEELTVTLSNCFGELLLVAYEAGGSLLKFGGDALLLLFEGDAHAPRAAVSAQRMQSTLGSIGRVTTTAGSVRLRMSVGVHSGPIHLFRVGHSHSELLLTGPGASETVAMESLANANEIVVSKATADQLDGGVIGAARGDGFLLRNRQLELVPAPIAPFHHLAPMAAGSVPVALRDELMAGAIESEHRRAAVGFIHFDGVDELLATSGPERVADALDELVSSVQTAVEANGVTFLATDADRDGGKIILVAGAPRALGDDSDRMLRALRRIADVRRTLPVRIGVTQGHVFVGSVGPEFRRTYTVMGDDVNLAARLMAKATGGQILATGAVLASARTVYDCEPLAPFLVKGKSEPIAAYAVGARSSSTQPDQVVAVEHPLVGRDKELQLLDEMLARTQAGRGGLVEISGPAGIGKSRLIEEMRTRAASADVVRVFCNPFETQTPYFAIRYMVRSRLGITVGGSASGDVLRQAVDAVAPHLLPLLPLLAAVVDVDVEMTDAVSSLEPRFRRERTRYAVVELLQAAVTTPTVLVVEDAQWLDALSAEVIAAIGAAADEHPWLIFVAQRNDVAPIVPASATRAVTLELAPLDDVAARALVTAATAGAPMLPHTRDALIERSGGNPLFLTELLRTRGDDAFPESLEAVVAIEIDRLPRDDRQMLRYASVLGATFEASLLADVTDGEIRSVAAAERRFGTFVEAAGPGLIRFRNQCYRQVAYDTLPFARRRELHARAGEAIERSVSGNEAERAGVLSLHFLHAQRYDRCWRYARMAADHASTRYANAEAVELYERALVARRHLRELDGRDVARVCTALGEVALLAGQFDRAKSAFTHARRLQPDDRDALISLCLKESQTALHQGRRVAADRWIHRGLRLIGETTCAEDLSRRAAFRTMYANNLQRARRPHDTLRWANLALEDARAAGDRAKEANAYLLLDWAHIVLGEPEHANNAQRALEIWESFDDVARVGEAFTYMGFFDYAAGN